MKNYIIKIVFGTFLVLSTTIAIFNFVSFSSVFYSKGNAQNGKPPWIGATGAFWTEDEARTDCYVNGFGSPEARAAYERDHGLAPSSSPAATSSSSKKKSSGPTLTEYAESDYAQMVVVSKKAAYDTYKSGRNEITSAKRGTYVTVTGKSSNGYYRCSFTDESGSNVEAYLLYKGKDNIVDVDTYEKAFAETDRKEATCTKDGFIKYTNSLSNLTKKDVLPALGHTEGEAVTETEPSYFSDGKSVVRCTVCNEVLSSTPIPQLMPISLTAFIIIICCAAGVVALIIFFAVRSAKKKKQNL